MLTRNLHCLALSSKISDFSKYYFTVACLHQSVKLQFTPISVQTHITFIVKTLKEFNEGIKCIFFACVQVWSIKLILIEHKVVVMTVDDALDVNIAANKLQILKHGYFTNIFNTSRVIKSPQFQGESIPVFN